MAENENIPIPKTQLVEEYRSMTTELIGDAAQIIGPVAAVYTAHKLTKQDKPKDTPPQEPPNKG